MAQDDRSMKGRALIVAATSGIGRAVAGALAREMDALVLAGRDVDECERVACDLRIRYQIDVQVRYFDALAFDGHREFVESIEADGELAGVVMCQGYLPDQAAASRDWAEARRTIDVNYTACVSLLNELATRFESRQRGFVCIVGSVAGDRGRQSNYLYGSAKAAVHSYAGGLRNRLHRAGVSVLTVKPGFVDTAMTWGLLDANSPMVGSPQQVGEDIARALRRGRNIIYTPWFWRWIMGIIGAIPEPIFKRLKL